MAPFTQRPWPISTHWVVQPAKASACAYPHDWHRSSAFCSATAESTVTISVALRSYASWIVPSALLPAVATGTFVTAVWEQDVRTAAQMIAAARRVVDIADSP